MCSFSIFDEKWGANCTLHTVNLYPVSYNFYGFLKVNTSNLGNIVRELFQENVVRGRYKFAIFRYISDIHYNMLNYVTEPVYNMWKYTKYLPTTNLMQTIFCRGLLAQAIIKAQSSSPTFTHVYAALVSVINTKVCQSWRESLDFWLTSYSILC